jgi:hypothetical protein
MASRRALLYGSLAALIVPGTAQSQQSGRIATLGLTIPPALLIRADQVIDP